MIVPYTNFSKLFRSQGAQILFTVGSVLDKGDMILGEEVKEFEKEFAKVQGADHAIGVANGTDSLIICMAALGVGPGDEVITAPNSWISSASSIALLGAKPVFADVGEDQLIDPEMVELAITRRTKAIIPVHLTGRMCDMQSLMELSKLHKVPILEDAAQAVGCENAGSFGLFGSFSLHPLKSLGACGDAGIITTNDSEQAKTLKLLRNHGLKDRNHISRWGYNSRLDSIQAAILRHRLINLPKVIERRRHLASKYTSRLKNIVKTPVDEGHTYHTYTIQCEQRDFLLEHLKNKNIETKIHYPIPIHLQECAKSLNYELGDFPNAEYQASRILSLPINEFLTEDQINYVCEKIEEFYARFV